MVLIRFGDEPRLTQWLRWGIERLYGLIHDAEAGERPPKAAEHGHGAMRRWIGRQTTVVTIDQPTLFPSTEAVETEALVTDARTQIVNRMTQQR
jgi:hypothetical protein